MREANEEFKEIDDAIQMVIKLAMEKLVDEAELEKELEELVKESKQEKREEGEREKELDRIGQELPDVPVTDHMERGDIRHNGHTE